MRIRFSPAGFVLKILISANVATFPLQLAAQDYFPEPVEAAAFTLAVEPVAVIPDSSPGNPARVSVVTMDPLGRLYANDQRGPLYTFNRSSGSVTGYLDLRDYAQLELLSTFEAGFQGFAFHPDFAAAGADGFGKFYTIHSSNDSSRQPDFDPGGSTSFHTLLLEWSTHIPESADFVPADPEAPYREVMRIKQPFGNHNAGNIAFNPLAKPADPDYGNLYIAVGDGGSGGDPQENGQDLSTVHGSILRIDPLATNSANGRYGIVPENAFAADSDATTLSEIYAYGFRNPQRFSWDIVTGKMFVADIGQNAVEEISIVVNGGNYGWDTREGSFSFEGSSDPQFIDPVTEYDHTNPVTDMPASIGNRAVTTGEVVRGAGITALEGHLILSDFPTGLIFMIDVDSDPLDGGQDGLRVALLSENGRGPVHLLDLINAARSERGLGTVTRADTRFSVNTPGQVYISNKRDGIIRRLVPDSVPSTAVCWIEGGQLQVEFSGLLQSTMDLETWETVLPQPRSPMKMEPGMGPLFFQTVVPD